jgi:hypothetical protein
MKKALSPKSTAQERTIEATMQTFWESGTKNNDIDAAWKARTNNNHEVASSTVGRLQVRVFLSCLTTLFVHGASMHRFPFSYSFGRLW